MQGARARWRQCQLTRLGEGDIGDPLRAPLGVERLEVATDRRLAHPEHRGDLHLRVAAEIEACGVGPALGDGGSYCTPNGWIAM